MRIRITRWLNRLTTEDVSPETIALSIVLGLALGVFPVYGCPTLLCVAAAFAVRPHVPLLHAINFVTSPLQLALIFPFHKVGERLLPAQAQLAGQGNWHAALVVYGFTTRVVAGWFLVCAPLGFALYLALAFTLRQYRAVPRCAVS